MTETTITPDRDPDEELTLEHPDLNDAEYVDENGPAFPVRYEEPDE